MIGELFRVMFSSRARHDLDRLEAEHTDRVSAANGRKLRRGIVDAAKKLERSPAARPILSDTEDHPMEIRYTKFWSYKIIFVLFHKAGEVLLLMIRHDAQDHDETLDQLP